MPKISCGLLVYRRKNNKLEFFLQHPGGPYYTKKEDACWSIPKGEVQPGEEYLTAAFREAKEETGQDLTGTPTPLTPVKTPAKTFYVWAMETDIDTSVCHSNFFEMVWPPKSRKNQTFPEVDRYAWFDLDQAKVKINQNLLPFVEEFINNNPTS